VSLTRARNLRPALAACCVLLLGVVGACGSDGSSASGTLEKDQVPGAKAEPAKRTNIPNRVTCQDIDNAEDELVYDQSPNAKKSQSSVVVKVKGDANESVDSSVWPARDASRSLEKIAAGVDACSRQDPGYYQALGTVPGYPEAIGYTSRQGKPPSFIKRVFVPVGEVVVVVGVTREGSDDFSVEPEDLLEDAVAAAKKKFSGSTGSTGY